MCQFCLMRDDDEDEGGAAASPAKRPAKPSRNYAGPFRKTPGRLFGMGFVRLYQITLSSLIGSSCRYLPTCSEYGYEAMARHGFWAGGWMTLFRFLRCGPGGGNGFDPVPETLKANAVWWRPWRYRHAQTQG